MAFYESLLEEVRSAYENGTEALSAVLDSSASLSERLSSQSQLP